VDVALRIKTVECAGSLVLAVEGELDIVSSPLLDEALVRARATDATSIVIDLVKISFIDSTGLHVLVKHADAESGRARIWLTKGSPETQRLFELSGAVEYLPFVSDWPVNDRGQCL
jgi:anti-anti-sigma factor